jgi:3-oxoacyl-[acyl-carrier-protein] synthase-3
VRLLIHAAALPVDGSSAAAHASALAAGDLRLAMAYAGSALQARFGLRDAEVLGLAQQGCTGWLGALRVAQALLAGRPAEAEALCVVADRVPPGCRYEQGWALVSDAAGACLVRRGGAGFRLLGHAACSNGALALADEDAAVGCFFPYAHRVVTEACAAARVPLEGVRWFVGQNTHARGATVLASLLGVDPERFVAPTRAALGHAGSADVLANLAALQAAGRLAPGDRCCLLAAGYGLQWRATVLEWTGPA